MIRAKALLHPVILLTNQVLPPALNLMKPSYRLRAIPLLCRGPFPGLGQLVWVIGLLFLWRCGRSDSDCLTDLGTSITNSWIGYTSCFGVTILDGGLLALIVCLAIATIIQWTITLGLAELASAFPSSGVSQTLHTNATWRKALMNFA